MNFAPRQNWPAYHSFVEPKQIEKDRLLNASQKLQRYAEIFDTVWSLKDRSQNGRFVDPLKDETMTSRTRRLMAYRNVPGPDCD